MKKVLAFAMLLIGSVPDVSEAQRLVLLVRHAERADGGAPAAGMTSKPDPPLSVAGETRARKLAEMLADAGIQAIFATEFRRTLETVKPLAERTGVPVTTIRADDTSALISRLKSAHAGDVVLITGHSNTLPQVVKGLGGPPIEIADGEYGVLYVLVPATGALSRIRF